MSKISIRFYNDREVRAVWDEENSKWWFSVLDIVGVLNDQDDYRKNRNYWKYLKTKLKSENSEVVSGTNQLKLLAAEFKFKATGFRFAKQKAKGEGGSWNYGITENWLRVATPDNGLQTPDNGGGSRNYGIMELRNYGGYARQQDN